LSVGGYRNDNGLLTDNPAFIKLARLAGNEADHITAADDFYLEPLKIPDEPFHIEADIYDSGDYANLLVIPTNGVYIVVGNDEHLATLIKTCEDPACWEQQDDNLEEELIEKVGTAIDVYAQSF
jgi:hypothetical protein